MHGIPPEAWIYDYSILQLPGKSNHFPGKEFAPEETFVNFTGMGGGKLHLSVQSTKKPEMLTNYEDMPLTNVRRRSIILNYYS